MTTKKQADSASFDMTRKTSAITLSDMEMFIFPELIYSLVLANIMSPRIWKWREADWFAGLARMKPHRRITRLKQYVMDHYAFNLDLDTWGLTTRERELERFKNFIDVETLKQANALFGYEGDKYYFDIDIRRHFGLDRYAGNVIPYWKTETVEAMDSFRFKPGYESGAGECVSLAALYAAALFVVAGVPLRDIYLMATPLHSQNFIDAEDGILTNNRRLVTRKMWFNGTALSAQARRALENEKITIVAHETGCIHTVYERATIDRSAYSGFVGKLSAFLKVSLTADIFGNFLRHSHEIQRCFQVRRPIHGIDHYIEAERVYAYEHGSPYLLTDNTRDRLLADIDQEEYQSSPVAGRIVLNDLEDFVTTRNIDLEDAADVALLENQFQPGCLHRQRVMEALLRFCRVRPQLPDADARTFAREEEPLGIDVEMGREEVIERLSLIRDRNVMADMAFYAYRDLMRTEPGPFLVAAIQRNPVSVEATKEMDVAEVVGKIRNMPDESIYDDPGRLAQPDEIWNYGRGDGVEKALLLANILQSREPEGEMTIDVGPDSATLKTKAGEYVFPSAKGLANASWTLDARC